MDNEGAIISLTIAQEATHARFLNADAQTVKIRLCTLYVQFFFKILLLFITTRYPLVRIESYFTRNITYNGLFFQFCNNAQYNTHVLQFRQIVSN